MRKLLAMLVPFFLLPSGLLFAQQMPEQQLEEQEEEAEEERIFGDLEEEDVDAFAEVHPKVKEREQEFIQALRNREDGQDSAEMQDEFSQERRQMIEDAGLSMQLYRQILSAMARNEELREYVEEKTGSSDDSNDE